MAKIETDEVLRGEVIIYSKVHSSIFDMMIWKIADTISIEILDDIVLAVINSINLSVAIPINVKIPAYEIS